MLENKGSVVVCFFFPEGPNLLMCIEFNLCGNYGLWFAEHLTLSDVGD